MITVHSKYMGVQISWCKPKFCFTIFVLVSYNCSANDSQDLEMFD